MFVVERSLPRLTGQLPAEVHEQLASRLAAYRRWVAEPALRAPSPEDAVEYVQSAIGPMVELRANFLAALSVLEGGADAFVEAIDDLPPIAPRSESATLAEAIDLFRRGQRAWVRFESLHPDYDALAQHVERVELTRLSTSGFFADTFISVCAMATEDDGEPVDHPIDGAIYDALCDAAHKHAAAYHNAVCSLAEQRAPTIDESDPFKPVTIDALLALPPFDGPTASPDDMRDAVEEIFGSP